MSTLEILIQRFGPTPHIPLADCYDLLGYSSNAAAQRAAWDHSLGIRTFRLRNSQKAPRMILLVELVEFLEKMWRR